MQCTPSVAEGRQSGLNVLYLEDRNCITKGLVVQKPACFGKGHFTGQGRMLRSCQGFNAPVKTWYRPRPLYDWRDEPRCCQDETATHQRSFHVMFAHDTGAWQGMHTSSGTRLAARVLHSSSTSLRNRKEKKRKEKTTPFGVNLLRSCPLLEKYKEKKRKEKTLRGINVVRSQ